MAIATNSNVVNNAGYNRYIVERIFPFSISRLMPFISTACLTLFLARASFDGLSVFGYLMSVFMIVTTILLMPLMVVGNLIAGKKKTLVLRTYLYTGIMLAFFLGAISMSINYAILDTIVPFNSFSGVRKEQIRLSANIYLSSTIIMGVNTFLFTYMEAVGQQRNVSISKTISSVSSVVFIITTLGVLESECPLIYAMGSFLLSEVILVILLAGSLFLSKSKKHLIQCQPFNYLQYKAAREVMRLGLPIGIGMGIQKIVYYLLNERLLSIDMQYVALLSVFSSITALLLIPIGAFSQANSLYISRKNGNCLYSFVPSLAGWSSLTGSILILGWLSFPYLLSLFGAEIPGSENKLKLLWAFMALTISSGFLTFATSALRGVHDTLVPQVAINCVMIGLFIPLIWSGLFVKASFTSFIYVQSSFLLLCGAALVIRYYSISKRIYNTEHY